MDVVVERCVTLVGMEATGVYWKTVFQALEERFEQRARSCGGELWLVGRPETFHAAGTRSTAAVHPHGTEELPGRCHRRAWPSVLAPNRERRGRVAAASAVAATISSCRSVISTYR